MNAKIFHVYMDMCRHFGDKPCVADAKIFERWYRNYEQAILRGVHGNC